MGRHWNGTAKQTADVPREVVWVADWEMQCCGDAFSVGGEISWFTSAADGEWLEVLFDDDAPAVDSAYDHHSNEPFPPRRAGRVVSIEAITCVYEQHDRTLVPVVGSAERSPRNAATGWEDDAEGSRRFVGYLVDVEFVEP